MPVGYHINHAEGLITIRVELGVDFVNLLETAGTLLADPDYDPDLPQLVDLRGMALKQSRTTEQMFNEFVVSQFGGEAGGSIAVVIDNNLKRQQCAAIYRLACAMGRAELFDSYEHALRWLIRREFAPETVDYSCLPEPGYDAAVVAELLKEADLN